MIDIRKEKLLSISEAAKMRPPTRRGRPTSPSTVFRWIAKGVRGRRLEAIRLGAQWFTSAEALQRFAEALTAGDPSAGAVVPAARSTSASDQLDRLGI